MIRLLPLAVLLVLVAGPASADPATMIITAAHLTGWGAALTRLAVGVGLSLLGRAMQGKPGGAGRAGIRTEVTLEGGTLPQTRLLGRTVTAGSVVAPHFANGRNGDIPNAFRYRITDLADHPINALRALWVDDTKFDVAADLVGSLTSTNGATPNPATRLEWTQDIDNLYVRFFDGRQTAADALLVTRFGGHAERPWGADRIGTGVPYVRTIHRYDQDVVTGEPQLLFEAEGERLYDRRKDSTAGGSGTQRSATESTWAYTENPMVMVEAILRGLPLKDGTTWGLGVAAADLPAAMWTTAADHCDEVVGSQARYRAGIEVVMATAENGGTDPFDVIDELLRACAGAIADVGGTWAARAGPPGLPVAWITDDDIVVSRPQELEPHQGITDVVNAVRALYANPGERWKSKEAPLRTDAAAQALDGERLVATLDLTKTVFSGAQAQRLQRAYLKDARRMRRHTVTLPPEYSGLMPLDTISWTSLRNGYTAKLFEVAEVAVDPRTLATTLAIREVDPADYDWSPTDELPETPSSGTPIVIVPEALPGLAVQGVILTDAAGAARRPGALLTWPTTLTAVRSIDWQIRVAATAAEGPSGSTTNIRSGRAVQGDLLPATPYQLRAKGDRTEWTSWLAFTTPDVRLGSSDLTSGLNDIIDEAAENAADALATATAIANTVATDTAAAIAAAIAARDAAEDHKLDSEAAKLASEAARGLVDQIVASTLLPSTFVLDGRFWTDAMAWVPGALDPSLAFWTFADTAQGRAAKATLPVAGTPQLNSTGVVPLTPGATYRITATYMFTGTPTVANPITMRVVGVDAAYANGTSLGTTTKPLTGGGVWQTETIEYTVPASPTRPWGRPSLFVQDALNDAGDFFVVRLAIEDVSSEKAAAGFASASSTSATAAGTSATAAAGLAAAVRLSKNQGPVLPSTLVDGLDDYTSTANGSPATTPLPTGPIYTLVTDADLGPAVEIVWPATISQVFLTRGVLPLTVTSKMSGRLRFKVMSITGASSVLLGSFFDGMLADYTAGQDHIINGSYSASTSVVQDVTVKVGPAADAAEGMLASPFITSATTVWGRFGIRLGEARACTIRVGLVEFRDISESMNAALEANAAAAFTVTAAGHAGTASGASASAQAALSLASEVIGRGAQVLGSQYLESALMTWAATGTAPVQTANEVYPVGKTLDFNEAGTADRWITLTSAADPDNWKGRLNATYYRVECEFDRISGTLDGAGLVVRWTNTLGTDFDTQVPFKTLARLGASDRYFVSTIVKKPSGFTGTFLQNAILLAANRSTFSGDGGGAKAAKRIKVHKLSVSEITDEEIGGGQVGAWALSQFYTETETDGAIAGQISTYAAVIQEPGGQIRSTLLTAYRTAALTDIAFAAADTALRSEIINTSGPQIGQIKATLLTNYFTQADTTSAISLATQTLEARLDNARFEKGWDFTGDTLDGLGLGLGATAAFTNTSSTLLTDRRVAWITNADAGLVGRLAWAAPRPLTLRKRTLRFGGAIYGDQAGATMRVRAARQVSKTDATHYDYLQDAGGAFVISNAAWRRFDLDVAIPDDEHPVYRVMLEVTTAAVGHKWRVGDFTVRDLSEVVDALAYVNQTMLAVADLDGALATLASTVGTSYRDLRADATFAMTAISDAVAGGRSIATISATTVVDGVTYAAGFTAIAYDTAGEGTGSAMMLWGEDVIAPGSVAVGRLTIGLKSNLLGFDTTGASGTLGFGLSGTGSVLAQTSLEMRDEGQTYAGATYPTYRLRQNATAINGTTDYAEARGKRVKRDRTVSPLAFRAKPGRWYDVSALAALKNCDGAIGIRWRDDAGAQVGVDLTAWSENTGVAGFVDTNPQTWPAIWAKAQCPAGASHGEPVFRKYGTKSPAATSDLFFCEPMVGRSHAAAREPSYYSAPDASFIDAGRAFFKSITFASGVVDDFAIGALNQRGFVTYHHAYKLLASNAAMGSWVDTSAFKGLRLTDTYKTVANYEVMGRVMVRRVAGGMTRFMISTRVGGFGNDAVGVLRLERQKADGSWKMVGESLLPGGRYGRSEPVTLVMLDDDTGGVPSQGYAVNTVYRVRLGKYAGTTEGNKDPTIRKVSIEATHFRSNQKG